MATNTNTMIDINLLPSDLAPTRLIKWSNLVIICLVALIVISLSVPLLRLMAEVQKYSELIGLKNDKIMEYRQEAERIRQLKEKVKLLNVRMSVVQELLQEKSTWSSKLVELHECIPRYGVWMTALTIEYKKNQRRPSSGAPTDVEAEVIMVYLSGVAVSVDKVSEFLASLEDSETFSDVVFESASGGPAVPGSDSSSYKTFRIGVQILVPGGEVQETVSKAGEESSV